MIEWMQKAAIAGRGAVVLGIVALLSGCVTNAPNTPPATTAANASGTSLSSLEIMEALLSDYLASGASVGRDQVASAAIIRRQAERGRDWAMIRMAELSASGQGVDLDRDLTIRYIRAVADRGNSVAEAYLGNMLLYGYEGLAADPVDGLRWLQRAAAKRNSSGMTSLGEAFRDGIGTRADPHVAFAWFDIAVQHARNFSDRDRAFRNRAEMLPLLLPEQNMAARYLSSEWRPGIPLLAGNKPASRAAPPRDIIQGIGQLRSITDVQGDNTDHAVSAKQYEAEITVAADGTAEHILRMEFLAHNNAGVSQLGEVALTFNSDDEVMEVVEAFTRKADGRIIPVGVSGIHVGAAPRRGDSPLYKDLKQTLIVFPQFEVGDSIRYVTKSSVKPIIDGQFSLSWPMPVGLPLNELRVLVRAPKSYPLYTETHGLRFERKDKGAMVEHEWRWENKKPPQGYDTALASLDRDPRLFISSAQNYDAIGQFYARRAAERSKITPAIQALADELTASTSDRRQQAELLYNWVRQRIRYVAVYLGREGGFVPREVGSILDSRYGDCKDHVALLSALLQAKGIESEAVLVNANNGYTLPLVATMAHFDHVITWLPEFSVYVDSTASVAPFGVLPFSEYGKPALHTSATKPVLKRIPVAPAATASTVSRVTLDREGRISGQTESTATGFLAVKMRQSALGLQGAGSDSARQALRHSGLEGTGRYDFGNVQSGDAQYRTTARFQAGPRREWVTGTAFQPPLLLDVADRPGNVLMGPLDFLDHRGLEPTPCQPGRQVSELTMELPPGKKLRELPKGLTLDNKFVSYKSSWTMQGRGLVVRREFEAKAGDPVCIGDRRRSVAGVLNQIRGDYATTIALIDE